MSTSTRDDPGKPGAVIPYPLLLFYSLGVALQQALMLVEENAIDIFKIKDYQFHQLCGQLFLRLGPEKDTREATMSRHRLLEATVPSEENIPDARTRIRALFEDFKSMLDGLPEKASIPEGRSWFRLGLAMANGRAMSENQDIFWKWDNPPLLGELLKEVGLASEDLFPNDRGVLYLTGAEGEGHAAVFVNPVAEDFHDAQLPFLSNMQYPQHLMGWYIIENRLTELVLAIMRQEGTSVHHKPQSQCGTENRVGSTVGAGSPTNTNTKRFEPEHSDDFRSVLWEPDQEPFSFKPVPARCVKVLWEHAVRGTPDVGQATILEAADSASARLIDLFKGHPAWGTMIVPGATKGSFRLSKSVKK